MGVTVKDFVGVWQINWATGPGNMLPADNGYLWIGTGSSWGDTAPELNGEYQTCLGFALVASDQLVYLSQEPLSSEHNEGNQSLLFLYDNGQLLWTGYYEQQPLRIFISAAEIQQPGGNRFISLYGNTVYGDPEQVGVWGGTGTPPPTPPERPRKPGGPEGA